ncbi:MAG: sulfotransferase family 2 domain-containing protein, partial [Candidatus Thiodiazotropha sp.]
KSFSVSERSGGGIQDSDSVENLAVPRSRVTTERHVTIAANGSLLYEVEVENTITYSDEKLQTKQDSKTLDLTTTVSPEILDDDHKARIQHLQEQCKRIPTMRTDLIGRSNITDFFYSPKYQFAYCKVPKSGSTFWMQLFMVCCSLTFSVLQYVMISDI